MATNSNNATLPQPSNPAELEAVLGMLLAPDTNRIKEGTAILKVFIKNASSIQPLMQQLASSPTAGVRQLAGVLIRQRLTQLWRKLPETARTEIKNTLLQRLLEESVRPVRVSNAALVAAIARLDIPDGKWSNLLDFLVNCTKSEKVSHREIAMMLFRNLAENISDAFKKQYKALQSVFEAGLKDPNENVRKEALKAVGVLVEYLTEESHLTHFRKIIPILIETVHQAVAAGDEDTASAGFGVFDTLAEAPTNVFQQHFGQLISLMLEMVSHKELDVQTRYKACSFVCSIIQSKSGQITKNNLFEPIMACGMSLVTEPFHDVFEAEQMTPQKMGVDILDGLAAALPKRLIMQPYLAAAAKLMSSANLHDRKGGLVILALMAENCSENLKEQLPSLLQAVCAGMKDSEAVVRAAACVALTQFGDYLQPEILQHHDAVIPNILMALMSTSETVMVKKKCCTSLEVFCEQIGEEISIYLDEILKALVSLLQSTQDTQLQARILLALKSVAASSKGKFMQYFHPTMNMLHHMMKQNKDELLQLRCAATECAGAVAEAVGKQEFAKYFQETLDLVFKGFTLNFFELRESSYHFLAHIANMLSRDFVNLLPTVMPLMLATLTSDDGVMLYQQEDELTKKTRLEDLEDPDEGDDDDDDASKLQMSIRTGALDEKVAAVSCLGNIVKETGDAFLPYLEKTAEALEELSEYPHHFIRTSVVQAQHAILELMRAVFPPTTKCDPGEIVPIPQQAKVYVDKFFAGFLLRITEEEDKECAATACEAFTEMLQMWGMAVLEGNKMEELTKALVMLLQEKAPCQQMEEDADEQEMADHDEVLIDSVTDLVEAMALVLGPKFEPIFSKHILKPLLRFTEDKRPDNDRYMAIGCIGEVASLLGPAMNPVLGKVIPTLERTMKDPSVQVRRNSIFSAGVLIYHLKEKAARFAEVVMRIIPKLLEIPKEFAKNSEWHACKDNASSALAKIFVATNNGAVNADTVRAFVGSLPIQSDFSECKYVYPTLCGLFSSHADLIFPLLPQVLLIASAVLPDEQVELDCRSGMAQFVKALAQQQGQQFQAALGSLPQDAAAKLMKALSS